jgi:hypothetical protein
MPPNKRQDIQDKPADGEISILFVWFGFGDANGSALSICMFQLYTLPPLYPPSQNGVLFRLYTLF